jgi:uncharacterized protein (DUF2062 family)
MVRRKIDHYTRRILSYDDPPERLAFAFAFGVFLSFTPFLGFHLVLGLAAAFLFGLNRVALLIGLAINNPWTLVPYYALATWLGGLLIGFPTGSPIPGFKWSQLHNTGFWLQLLQQWHFLIPMALGSTILAALCAALSYPLALYAIKRGRARLGRRQGSEIAL